MPPRRNVHFSSRDIYHSYDVLSPDTSPSFSNSSLDSNEGPMTPPRPTFPPLVHEVHPSFPNSPASFTYVQPQQDNTFASKPSVQLHPRLVPSLSHMGLKLWKDKDTYKRALESSPTFQHVLEDAATTPPLNEITIKSDSLFPAQKDLRIVPSAGNNLNSHVTVKDLLLGIHTELHKSIGQLTYNSLSVELKNGVKDMYNIRCQYAPPGESQRIRDNGVMLVDLLRRRQLFAGLLKKDDYPPNVWCLMADRDLILPASVD